MGRKVCFVDDGGQVGTCIRDDENCNACDKETLETMHNGVSQFVHKNCDLLDTIKKHEFTIDVDFVDDNVIIYGSASKDGINVFASTRCFQDDLNCELVSCLSCLYVCKSREQAIFDKYRESVTEILKEAYQKIEVMR
jgi:hypothetical protein